MYTLEPLNTETTTFWDEILRQCPDSTAFHSTAWCQAISDSFRQLTPTYCFIQADDAIIGGLPAFVFQPISGIRMLHSMPWNLCGGIHLINESRVNFDALVQTVDAHFVDFVAEQNICETVLTLTPRQTLRYGNQLINSKYEKRADLFTHLLKTHLDYDVLWRAYNKRVRGAVRKAKKTGVIVYDTDSRGDLDAFYQIYLTTMNRLKATPKPFSLFFSLYRSRIAKLAVAKYDGLIIAGLFYLHFNRTVTLWQEAYVKEFVGYRPINAIFDHIIRWACEAGYEWVDFGASPPDHHGLIAHKEQYRAKRFDFRAYIKVHSSLKKAMWQTLEPPLRQIYTWLQYTRSDM